MHSWGKTRGLLLTDNVMRTRDDTTISAISHIRRYHIAYQVGIIISGYYQDISLRMIDKHSSADHRIDQSWFEKWSIRDAITYVKLEVK